MNSLLVPLAAGLIATTLLLGFSSGDEPSAAVLAVGGSVLVADRIVAGTRGLRRDAVRRILVAAWMLVAILCAWEIGCILARMSKPDTIQPTLTLGLGSNTQHPCVARPAQRPL